MVPRAACDVHEARAATTFKSRALESRSRHHQGNWRCCRNTWLVPSQHLPWPACRSAPSATSKVVGRCSDAASARRLFCSKACQAVDWKKGAHKHWCGAAGEVDTDYQVQAVAGNSGKGLGLLALRPFKRYEVVLVERPLAKRPYSEVGGLTAPEGAALQALQPDGAPLWKKLLFNQVTIANASAVVGVGVFCHHVSRQS